MVLAEWTRRRRLPQACVPSATGVVNGGDGVRDVLLLNITSAVGGPTWCWRSGSGGAVVPSPAFRRPQVRGGHM